MPALTLISAVARNRVIGNNNALPWRLPEDLAFFKQTTLGHPILMGRSTWDSIGRPLPGRCNIVLTRQGNWHPAGLAETVPCCHATEFTPLPDVKTRVVVCNHLEQALDVAARQAGEQADLYVIGGAQIYASLLPQAKALVLTEIDRDFEGDALFPVWDRAQFAEVSRQTHHKDAEPAFDYSFVRYERRPDTTHNQEST
jgi:dihydrofolate reductase